MERRDSGTEMVEGESEGSDGEGSAEEEMDLETSPTPSRTEGKVQGGTPGCLMEVGIDPPATGVKRNAEEVETKEECQSLIKRAREADPLDGPPTSGSLAPSGGEAGRTQPKPGRAQWPSDGDRRRKEATVMSSWTRTPRG